MFDRDMELKQLIAANIKSLMEQRGWTQIKLSQESGISKSTLSDYIRSNTLISPGNVQKLAETFNVSKSRIDPSFRSRTEMDKDELDIQKSLQKIVDELKNPYAAFGGRTLEEMDEEDRELLIASLENSLRVARRITKQTKQ